jgi:hypothetical protein
MLIRSQDKTALVKFENIVVNLKLPDSLNIICWSLQDAQRSGGYFILGKYSTKEKAMKVLDMIQEAYPDAKLNEILLSDVCKATNESQMGKDNTLIAKTIRKGFMKKMIFQMPEDSEVEV